jgi:UDP-GlcNAc3NAcA epimerase
VPCLTLRDESEWKATIETGWNKLVGIDLELILDSWFNFIPPAEHPPIYGVGTAAQHIVEIINKNADQQFNCNKVFKN